MRFTNYIDCFCLGLLKRHELEKKYIELIKNYELLEDSSVDRFQSYVNCVLSFILGVCLTFIIFSIWRF